MKSSNVMKNIAEDFSISLESVLYHKGHEK